MRELLLRNPREGSIAIYEQQKASAFFFALSKKVSGIFESLRFNWALLDAVGENLRVTLR